MTAQAHGALALRDLVRQTVLAGASRRAALLHIDRLPQALARPHHHRLARGALDGLANRDHAQSFDLPHGRLAIIWRSRGPEDIADVMAGLEHLLADLPPGQAVPMGQLISVFDLPDQAPWLLDTLAEPANPAMPEEGDALDPALLARLEENLLQADLSPFLRRRAVMRLGRPGPSLAWEDRFIAVPELVDCLCPGRHVPDSAWLAHRLARSIDRRALALLTGPRDLSGSKPLSLSLCVASLVSPAFLAFDAALPAALRGHVVLRLVAADILSDATSFGFARDFAHTRGYELLLRDTGTGPDGWLDASAAGLDYIEMRVTPALLAGQAALPDPSRLVLTCVDDAAALAWAVARQAVLVKGLAAQP
jgi:hypothetical protein